MKKIENTQDITSNIITTINTIFDSLFSSIDSNLYKILDDLIFINQNILNDKYFDKLFGTSTANGILLISNSLLIGFLIYYSAKFLLSNFTFSQIEHPFQFIFKCIIFGIFMNSSFFIVEQILNFNFNICELIKSLGEDLFEKKICFTELINEINLELDINKKNIDIFTIDGLIKGTLTISLLNLVFSYSLRYILIKIFILLSPFAFLSLTLNSTSHIFKSWYKSLFSLLFIQLFVALILLLLFSMDYAKGNLINKFIYIGGIYALIKANSIVRQMFGSISTEVQSNLSTLNFINKGG